MALRSGLTVGSVRCRGLNWGGGIGGIFPFLEVFQTFSWNSWRKWWSHHREGRSGRFTVDALQISSSVGTKPVSVSRKPREEKTTCAESTFVHLRPLRHFESSSSVHFPVSDMRFKISLGETGWTWLLQSVALQVLYTCFSQANNRSNAAHNVNHLLRTGVDGVALHSWKDGRNFRTEVKVFVFHFSMETYDRWNKLKHWPGAWKIPALWCALAPPDFVEQVCG